MFWIGIRAFINTKIPRLRIITGTAVNFRINSFKAFVRAENLNTFRNTNGNWGFTNNNFAAYDYAYPGLLIRVGIFWGFVN